MNQWWQAAWHLKESGVFSLVCSWHRNLQSVFFTWISGCMMEVTPCDLIWLNFSTEKKYIPSNRSWNARLILKLFLLYLHQSLLFHPLYLNHLTAWICLIIIRSSLFVEHSVIQMQLNSFYTVMKWCYACNDILINCVIWTLIILTSGP